MNIEVATLIEASTLDLDRLIGCRVRANHPYIRSFELIEVVEPEWGNQPIEVSQGWLKPSRYVQLRFIALEDVEELPETLLFPSGIETVRLERWRREAPAIPVGAVHQIAY